MGMKNVEFMGHKESQFSSGAEIRSDWIKDNSIRADPDHQLRRRERLYIGIISIRNGGITH